jgi:hypothetical protein
MGPPLTGKSLILHPPTEGEGSMKCILSSLLIATLPFGSVLATAPTSRNAKVTHLPARAAVSSRERRVVSHAGMTETRRVPFQTRRGAGYCASTVGLWLRCVLLDVAHALAVPIGNQRPVVPDKRLIAELGLAQVAGVEFEDENIALVAGNLKSEKGTFRI